VIDFPQVLRNAGLTVVEVDGWATRTHPGAFTPVGVVWHHTGGLNALDTVLNGRSDLAGPLANLYLDKLGTFYVVAGGVAWHAGPGSQKVLDDVQNNIPPAGDASVLGLIDNCLIGNHMFVGIEVENLGTVNDPYPPVQLAALIVGTAAICKALGVPATHCIHHREWTARKVDMSYRGDLRSEVAAILAPAPAPTPPDVLEGVDVPVIIRAAGRPAAKLGPDLKAVPLSSPEWSAAYHLNKADPSACRIVTISTADHDTFTGRTA
jgi:hypothetical protein